LFGLSVRSIALQLALGMLTTIAFLPAETAAISSATVHSGKCHAFCNEQHGIVKGWTGPERDSMEDAQKDADAHNERYHESKGDVGVLCD
jgi:hypothetical protein